MTMPQHIAVRAYEAADADMVRALHARAFRVLAAAHHTAAQIAAHEELIMAPDYAEDLARSHLLLAIHAEVGLVGTAGWLAMADSPGTARIRKVFVDPAHARRGLASLMVRAAERDAAVQGYQRLFVRANINAVPLYERLGYHMIEAGTMPAGGELLPVTFMARDTDLQAG